MKLFSIGLNRDNKHDDQSGDYEITFRVDKKEYFSCGKEFLEENIITAIATKL